MYIYVHVCVGHHLYTILHVCEQGLGGVSRPSTKTGVYLTSIHFNPQIQVFCLTCILATNYSTPFLRGDNNGGICSSPYLFGRWFSRMG